FNHWTYQVFNILLISVFLLKRKYCLAVFFVLVQIFFFSVNSHKSVLLYPVLIISSWYYFSRTRSLTVIPLGLALVIFGSLFVYFVFDNMLPSSFLIRRVFFVP